MLSFLKTWIGWVLTLARGAAASPASLVPAATWLLSALGGMFAVYLALQVYVGVQVRAAIADNNKTWELTLLQEKERAVAERKARADAVAKQVAAIDKHWSDRVTSMTSYTGELEEALREWNKRATDAKASTSACAPAPAVEVLRNKAKRINRPLK